MSARFPGDFRVRLLSGGACYAALWGFAGGVMAQVLPPTLPPGK